MNIENPMIWCVGDLHGNLDRYEALFAEIENDPPDVLCFAGDLLPGWHSPWNGDDFIIDYIGKRLEDLRSKFPDRFPLIFAILGNDDPRINESSMQELEKRGIWKYIHFTHDKQRSFDLFGYSYVPPTPFRLKDWERYDVSRFVDPGCVSPEEGSRTVEVNPIDVRYGTIRDDLAKLTKDFEPDRAVMLFHSPPYKTRLDRAALDGMMIDYAPLDIHVGSIAIKEFIIKSQPRITFHGHVHESSRLTGHWREKIGTTWSFNVSTDTNELAIVRVPFLHPEDAERKLISIKKMNDNHVGNF